MFFFRIITVNQNLEEWSKQNLNCKKVQYLPNFPKLNEMIQLTKLRGEVGKRILILANWRPQKNLEFLLKIVQRLKLTKPDWTFHLVGLQFNDTYQQQIEEKIKNDQLENYIFVYGSCEDVFHVLKQADIGILTSYSEGLPVSLLEYGWVGLPVVSTNVGEISSIVSDSENGFLIDSNDLETFVNRLNELIKDFELRKKMGNKLKTYVENTFSEQVFLKKYVEYIYEK
jgi:glycosyltransferase involved in cell wall biosynthesis